MSSYQYIIIGGGVSGLYAAYLLEQRGITDYLLIEANDVLGGRLKSMPINEDEAFDLGATWFWPNEQTQLSNVIHDFGLTTFDQYQIGEMLIDRSLLIPPQRWKQHSPESKRVKGGMKALIDKVVSKLDQTHIYFHIRSLNWPKKVNIQKYMLNALIMKLKCFLLSRF